jgi:hypothetical protein
MSTAALISARQLNSSFWLYDVGCFASQHFFTLAHFVAAARDFADKQPHGCRRGDVAFLIAQAQCFLTRAEAGGLKTAASRDQLLLVSWYGTGGRAGQGGAGRARARGGILQTCKFVCLPIGGLRVYPFVVSLDLFLHQFFHRLCLAAAEVDDTAFSNFTPQQRTAKRAAFYRKYSPHNAGLLSPQSHASASAAGSFSNSSSSGSESLFAVPSAARKDLLPPMALDRLHTHNELAAVRWATAERAGAWLRDGLASVAARLRSLRRHLDAVLDSVLAAAPATTLAAANGDNHEIDAGIGVDDSAGGSGSDDHLAHAIWCCMATYHSASVHAHTNDAIDVEAARSNCSHWVDDLAAFAGTNAATLHAFARSAADASAGAKGCAHIFAFCRYFLCAAFVSFHVMVTLSFAVPIPRPSCLLIFAPPLVDFYLVGPSHQSASRRCLFRAAVRRHAEQGGAERRLAGQPRRAAALPLCLVAGARGRRSE